MCKTLFVVLVATLVMSFSVFAGNTQRANLTAALECNGCKNKVEKALKNTKGVEKVSIDLKDQSVKVDYDKDLVTEAKLIEAINTADAKFNAKVADVNSGKNTNSVKSEKDAHCGKHDAKGCCGKKCNK